MRRLPAFLCRQSLPFPASKDTPESIIPFGILCAELCSLGEVWGFEIDQDEGSAGIVRSEVWGDSALIIEQRRLPEEVFDLDLSHGIYIKFILRGADGPSDIIDNVGYSAIFWCPGEDSNLHGFHHWYLKPARLPIPPPGHEALIGAGSGSCQYKARLGRAFVIPFRAKAL